MASEAVSRRSVASLQRELLHGRIAFLPVRHSPSRVRQSTLSDAGSVRGIPSGLERTSSRTKSLTRDAFSPRRRLVHFGSLVFDHFLGGWTNLLDGGLVLVHLAHCLGIEHRLDAEERASRNQG